MDKQQFLARHLLADIEDPRVVLPPQRAGHNLSIDPSWKGRLARIVRRLVPRPDMVYMRRRERQLVPRFLERVAEGGNADAFVLNVGSGNKPYGPTCINLDIFEAQHVDVVSPSHRIPFPDAVFAGVMSLAVLEHVPDDRPVLAECARVLKPGGLCLHAVPFIQGFHAVPDDYRRYTLHGLREVLSADFEEIESGVLLGPASALAWILREFFATLTAGRSVLLYNAGMLFYGWLFWPLKFLDVVLMRSPFAPQIASGVYFLGRRRTGASVAQPGNTRPA